MDVNIRALQELLDSARARTGTDSKRRATADAHQRIDIVIDVLAGVLGTTALKPGDPACYAVRMAKAAKPDGVTWKRDVVRAITDAIRAFGRGDMNEIEARTINQLAEAMGRLMKNDVESSRQYLRRAAEGCPGSTAILGDPPGGLPQATKIDWEAIGSPQALIARAMRLLDIWIETRPEKTATMQPGPEGELTEPA